MKNKIRLILIFTIFFFSCTHRIVVNTDYSIANRLSNWSDKETIKPVLANSHIISILRSNKIVDTKHFWDSITAKGTPMFELLPDKNSLLLTFLHRDSRDDIQINFDIPSLIGDTCYGDKQLRHIENSDVWYRTYKIPKDLAASYRYLIKSKTDTKITMDLLNKHRTPLGLIVDYSYNSFDYLLDSSKVWFYDRVKIKKGTVLDFDIESKILKNSHNVKVYKPFGYNESHEYPVIVVFDQLMYVNKVPLPIILDNLIAANKIPPCVAIMIDNEPSERRSKELPLYKPFADFVATELMPWAYQQFDITKDPEKTISLGASYGGLASSFIAFSYPKVFGNVISQSGSYWRGLEGQDSDHKWLIKQYEASPKLPIRFYLDCGLQENFIVDSVNFLAAHRQMRDVLKTKGYELYYQEFQGGHELVNWRKTLPDGLIVIFDKMKK